MDAALPLTSEEERELREIVEAITKRRTFLREKITLGGNWELTPEEVDDLRIFSALVASRTRFLAEVVARRMGRNETLIGLEFVETLLDLSRRAARFAREIG